MIHNDVLNQLQLLVKTSVPPLVEVAETPAELPQWVAGQKLPAHVLASLPNGRFQVSVDDQVLDMNLPKNTQPGENIVLVFVANQPRLTFVLSREAQASSRASATTSTAAAAASRGELPLPAGAEVPKGAVTLSDTARFLGALMQKVAEKNYDAQASPLLKADPLVAAPPADSKEFARVLRGALSQSGLFYESHQAQWVAGERSLAELLREPQGKLSLANTENPLPRNPPGSLPAGDAQKTPIVAENGKVLFAEGPRTQPGLNLLPDSLPGEDALKAQISVRNGENPPSADTLKTPASSSPPASTPPPVDVQKAHVLANSQADAPPLPAGKPMELVHPDTLPLIQQQLTTLDARQMVWQGLIWPGQTMDWIVEEGQGGRGGSGDDEAVHWQTKLRLQLPCLGNVSAALAFTPQGLRISLAAAETATAETLKAAQGKLQRSLDTAGLALVGLTVERDEHA